MLMNDEPLTSSVDPYVVLNGFHHMSRELQHLGLVSDKMPNISVSDLCILGLVSVILKGLVPIPGYYDDAYWPWTVGYPGIIVKQNLAKFDTEKRWPCLLLDLIKPVSISVRPSTKSFPRF